LYPCTIEFKELWGGEYLHFIEHPNANSPDGDEWEFVNDEYHHTVGNPTGGAPVIPITKAYVTLCPVPWADTDGDMDVDQADFGAFQNCFTGDTVVAPLSTLCKCLDRAGTTGTITVEDLSAFMSCFSGPGVPILNCP
jgi:hypothetical protein